MVTIFGGIIRGVVRVAWVPDRFGRIGNPVWISMGGVSAPAVRYFDFSGALVPMVGAISVLAGLCSYFGEWLAPKPSLQAPRAETWVERFTARMYVACRDGSLPSKQFYSLAVGGIVCQAGDVKIQRNVSFS